MTLQGSSGKPKKHRVLLLRRVAGKSMLPLLRPGQLVVVAPKWRYREEDVVVVAHNDLEKIKRIRSVQYGKYDVRGDNSAASTDSRHFGLLERRSIIGKVIWPRV